MQTTNSDSVHITRSVAQVRGESFSKKLRDSVGQSPLIRDLPPGAQIAFHNTEYCALMAILPFAGTDRVPTRTDRAELVFDWTKTGLSSNQRLSSTCSLPDREPGFVPLTRESLTAWFERIHAALPEALVSAKFFHSMREEYRLAYLGSLLNDLFRKSSIPSRDFQVYVIGNGYPESVSGASETLVSVAPTNQAGARQSAIVVESLGGKLVEHVQVVGGGMLLNLGKTQLFILTREVFESFQPEPSRYYRRSLVGTDLEYRSIAHNKSLLVR